MYQEHLQYLILIHHSNPRWRTGKRVFRLTSSSTNSEDRTNVATSAEADYDAKGLLETTQEAIVSTREARTQRTEKLTSTRTTTRNASRVIAVRRQRIEVVVEIISTIIYC